MASFILKSHHIEKMMELAQFKVPNDEYIIIGLRGCLPQLYEDQSERTSHILETQNTDNQHMRCSIILWKPSSGVFSVYPGSTVPSTAGLKAQFNAGSEAKVSNQLVTCFLSYAKFEEFSMDRRYRKRIHGGSISHWALGNDSKQPVQRTFDNTIIDGNDNIFSQVVNDNIHCSNNPDPNKAGVGSFGCQTIAGTARHGSVAQKHKKDKVSGAWKDFKNKVYSSNQRLFSYALFYGYEAQKTAVASETRRPTVRFGSTGELVKLVQNALNKKGYPCGIPDGIAGFDTMKQVFEFQKDEFSTNGADLIVGAGTASALNIDTWPNSSLNIADIELTIEDGIIGIDSGGNTQQKRSNVPTILTGKRAKLDTSHKPLEDWKIIEDRDQNGKKVWFLSAKNLPSKFKIGKKQFYDGHSQLNCTGISRHHQHEPITSFNPRDWHEEFGTWSYIIDGLIQAESDGNFGVCNAYDVAGFTAFCSQLAAHTDDDLLLGLESVVKSIPEEAAQFFPELRIIDDRLHYAYDGSLIDMHDQVEPYDGKYFAKYYYGHLMGFLNPNRQKVDKEEIEAAARFAAWSYLSENFRKEQIRATISNAKNSLNLIHNKMRKSASLRKKFPEGVNGLRGDWIAAIVHIPHIAPSKALDAAKLLLHTNPLLAAENYTIKNHEGRTTKVARSIEQYNSELANAKYNSETEKFNE